MADYSSPEAVRAGVAAQIAAADARRTRIESLSAEVSATVGTARSPRGEVEVTATAAAAITGIRLSDEALELSPDELSRMLTETIARAQIAASEHALVAATEALGADSAFVEQLRADVASRRAAPGDGIRW